MRKDGDSNPGNPFGVYSLSRRASSTTPASFHYSGAKVKIYFYFSLISRLFFSKLRIFVENKLCFSLPPSDWGAIGQVLILQIDE